MAKVIIEDELHAEVLGEFPDMTHAIAELRRYAEIPWNEPPNRAPCTSWRTCGRAYEVIEYDDSATPGREVCRTMMLEVSADGVKWSADVIQPPTSS